MPKQFVTISRNLSIAIQIHKWSYGDCFIFLCHFIFRFSFHRSPHTRSGETEGSPAEDNTLSTTQHPRGSSPVQSSRLTSNNSLLGSLGHVPTCFPFFFFSTSFDFNSFDGFILENTLGSGKCLGFRGTPTILL